MRCQKWQNRKTARFLIRAHDRGEAQSFALKQARAQFGSNAGAVVIDSTKEIG